MKREEKCIVLKNEEYEKYSRLMAQDSVDLAKNGLDIQDSFCLGTAKFEDGITADLMVCTETTTLWVEVWWYKDGEVIETGVMSHTLKEWHDLVLDDRYMRVHILSETEEMYWKGCRDMIHAWATR